MYCVCYIKVVVINLSIVSAISLYYFTTVLHSSNYHIQVIDIRSYF